MDMRKAEEKDYGQIASLYANFFETHDIFRKTKGFVMDYLRIEAEKHELLVCVENEIVKGALFIVGLGKSQTHKRWKFRHFAFETERIAETLLEEAERKVRELSRTAKIELTIAENEEGLDFYKKQGYSQEGMLKNHYRWGEVCFVLGKSISQ